MPVASPDHPQSSLLYYLPSRGSLEKEAHEEAVYRHKIGCPTPWLASALTHTMNVKAVVRPGMLDANMYWPEWNPCPY